MRSSSGEEQGGGAEVSTTEVSRQAIHVSLRRIELAYSKIALGSVESVGVGFKSRAGRVAFSIWISILE